VDFQMVLLLIGLAGIIYGSAMAFTQTSLRLILGYSSVAQLGFITLGIFAFREEGVQGAILQSVNHGLVVAPIFFIIALIVERAGGSEDIRELGGLAFRGPVLATLFLIVALATLAIPGSANFAGEFLILLGVFKAKLAIALIASTGVVLASVYMLRAYIRAMHNRPGAAVAGPRDLRARDGLVLVPLVVCILAFGLYPQAALEDGEQAMRGETSVLSEVHPEVAVIR
jgi:NADH-quinone oxidoreductase subunit M